jgi:hypothetical protein
VPAGRWGFIDRKGAVVAAPCFTAADSFAQGRARVIEDGRPFLIDPRGRPAASDSSVR